MSCHGTAESSHLYGGPEAGDLGLRLRPGVERRLKQLISLSLTPQHTRLQLQHLRAAEEEEREVREEEEEAECLGVSFISSKLFSA